MTAGQKSKAGGRLPQRVGPIRTHVFDKVTPHVQGMCEREGVNNGQGVYVTMFQNRKCYKNSKCNTRYKTLCRGLFVLVFCLVQQT